jgi:hypothetical protein
MKKLLLAGLIMAVLHLAVVSQPCYAQSMQITTVGDNTVNMLLMQNQGGVIKQFLAALKGSVTCNASGKVESLNGTIQTLKADDGKTTTVVKTELKDGTVIVSTEDGQTYIIYDLSSNLVGKIRTGSQSSVQPTVASTQKSEGASANAPSQSPAVLTAGGTAYVRVKQYSILSDETDGKAMKEMSGATGWALKNLNPNIQLVTVMPSENDVSFSFGDALTLIEKKDGVPAFWLVAKGQNKVLIPAYVLTANKAEIDFLKEKNRIPETMCFVYHDEHTKVWGDLLGGMGGSSIIDSHGLSLLAYRDGTSPFAIKENAVVFDASEANTDWGKPPVFDDAKKAFQLSPTCLYYCVSDGDKPAFECIDLAALKISK